MKLLFLLAGLALGFGGGVWWGVRNPAAAQKLSAAEERQFLEAQAKATQALRDKLDQIIAKKSASPPPGASGVVPGRPASPAVSESDLAELRDQAAKQTDELNSHLKKLEAK